MARRTTSSSDNKASKPPAQAKSPRIPKVAADNTKSTNPALRSSQAATLDGAATSTHHNPTPDEIRRRAYAIYLARGERGGDPDADWLQAERELRAGR
jgi:hypothetical protein